MTIHSNLTGAELKAEADNLAKGSHISGIAVSFSPSELAAHDAQVAARTLREAAENWNETDIPTLDLRQQERVHGWLMEQVNILEGKC